MKSDNYLSPEIDVETVETESGFANTGLKDAVTEDFSKETYEW